MDRLLHSRKEAAYMLSISLRKLDTLLSQKRLNTIKLDGRVLIAAGELKRFARANHFIDLAGSRPRQDAEGQGERSELSA